jgi:hypothetical protein
LAELIALDLGNRARIVDMTSVSRRVDPPAIVDLGAYETAPFGRYDFTEDDIVNLQDWPALAACQFGPNTTPIPDARYTVDDCLFYFDGDADGDVDSRDVARFQSLAE